MANYYTEFSVMLPLPAGENVAERLAAWSEQMEARKEADEDEWLIGTHWELQKDGIWTYSYASEGNAEGTATLIQQYLRDFDIEGGIFMTIAGYCSKPRINEAWGAAVVVTKDDQMWLNTGEVLRQAAEAGIEVVNM